MRTPSSRTPTLAALSAKYGAPVEIGVLKTRADGDQLVMCVFADGESRMAVIPAEPIDPIVPFARGSR